MGHTCGYFWVNNEPLITLGPHSCLFVCTLTCFVGFGAYMMSFMKDSSYQFYMVCAIIVQFVCYSMVALKNPGIASALNPDDPEISRFEGHRDFCATCRIVRDKDTAHCYDCNVCISGYDHHCPWTGKCIGKGNLIPFYVFLCSTFGYIIFMMAISFTGIVSNIPTGHHG
mmetsp:Transcript_34063/g.30831  ORF Transcript_34063/g.30831 Transcript_34063/m.30831 type:complete len:170 (+) Transcript_34063:192-701(+)